MLTSYKYSFFDHRRPCVGVDVDPGFTSGSRLNLNLNTGKRRYTLYDDRERAAVWCIERSWKNFLARRIFFRLALTYYSGSRKSFGRFTMLPVDVQLMVLGRLSLMDIGAFLCVVRDC